MKKKYVVRLTVTMIAETDAEDAEFFFEDHYCCDNLVNQLYEQVEIAGEQGTCATCYRSEVKLIGEATAEDIRKYGQNCQRETAVQP